MNSNIELPSGKVLALDRFIALLPSEDTKSDCYSLILEGYSGAIAIDRAEADTIKQHLATGSNSHKNCSWDREEQIRLNQPKLKLLKKRIERLEKEAESSEKEAEFESFKEIIDAERPIGQKLYKD